ncbi:MAG: LacI family transcriptional regulator [Phycisphaerae bacterium]|nr:LacI family transcriptional regulator [Phycisphaerae bacterium]
MENDSNVLMVDVAREAKVSRAAVSYVVNKRAKEKRIPLATQRKIERACKKLGYRPNYLATAMMTKKTQTIGMLYPNGSNFVGGLIRGTQSALREHGLQTMLCIYDDDPRIEAEDLDVFEHRHMDGVIAFPVWATSESLYWRRFVRSGRPVVFVDCLPPGVQGDLVGLDNFLVGHQAAEKLHQEGVRRVVLVASTHHRGNAVVDRRLAGFEAGLRDVGLPEPTVINLTDIESLARILVDTDEAVGLFAATVTTMTQPLKVLLSRGGQFNPNVVFSTCGLAEESFYLRNKWWMAEYPAFKVGQAAGLAMVQQLGSNVPTPTSQTVPFTWRLNTMTEAEISLFQSDI